MEGSLVPERDIDEAVVRERAHGRNRSALLSTALGRSANEDTSILAPVFTLLPLSTSLVPEGFPLRGEVAVAGRDAEEDGVVLLEDGGVGQGWDRVVFRGSVHFGEDFLGKGLLDAVQIGGTF